MWVYQLLAITVVSKSVLEGLPWGNRKPPPKPCLICKGESLEVGLSKRAQFTMGWPGISDGPAARLGLQLGLASSSRSPGWPLLLRARQLISKEPRIGVLHELLQINFHWSHLLFSPTLAYPLPIVWWLRACLASQWVGILLSLWNHLFFSHAFLIMPERPTPLFGRDIFAHFSTT